MFPVRVFDLTRRAAPRTPLKRYRTPILTPRDALEAISLDRIKVLSLDVFDTSVSRIFAKPHDLFLFVQSSVLKKHGINLPFADVRREAEQLARDRARQVKSRQEISLNEIYAALEELGFSGAHCALYKDEEIQAELAHAYSVPIVKEIYLKAREQNLPISFTSDMYLSNDVIQQILQSCGYNRYSFLFVSSEIQKTKATGELFQHIVGVFRQHKLITNADQIMHIGDNLQSDIQRAQQLGLGTCRVKSPIDEFQKVGLGKWPLVRRLEAFRSNEQRLNSSIIQGLFAKDWQYQGERPHNLISLRDIGFYVVGPMLYGFARWLHEQCRLHESGTLFFLARDGLIFKKAFDLLLPILNPNTKSEYIYVSRRALNFPSISKLDAEALEFLTRTWVSIPAYELLTRLGIDPAPFRADLELAFGQHNSLISPYDERPREFFRRIFTRILPSIEEERDHVIAYLKRKGLFNGKLAVCDIGYRGTMQSSIGRLAKLEGCTPEISGYYFATFKNGGENCPISGWVCDDEKPLERFTAINDHIALLELFFTAQHGTVLNILPRDREGAEAALAVPSAVELDRFIISEEIQAGALSFVQQLVENNLVPSIDIDPDLAIAGWESLTQFPSKPLLNLLAKAKHNDGPGLSSYVPIIDTLTIMELIFHPRSTLGRYRNSLWRTGSMAASSKASSLAVSLVAKLHSTASKLHRKVLALYS